MNQESSTTRHTYCQEMFDKSYFQYCLLALCPCGKYMPRTSSRLLAAREYSPVDASAMEIRQHSSPFAFTEYPGIITHQKFLKQLQISLGINCCFPIMILKNNRMSFNIEFRLLSHISKRTQCVITADHPFKFSI